MLLVSLAFAAPTGDQTLPATDKPVESPREESRLIKLFQKFSKALGLNDKSGTNSGVNASNIEEVKPYSPLPEIPDDIWREKILSNFSKNEFNDFRLANKEMYSKANLRLIVSTSIAKACNFRIAKTLINQQWSAGFQDEARLLIYDREDLEFVRKCLWTTKKWVETLDDAKPIRVLVSGSFAEETVDLLSDKNLFEITKKVHFRISLKLTTVGNQSEKLIQAIKENKCIYSLDILCDGLGEGRGAKLASLLDQNSTLQELGLWRIDLGPDDAIALAEALKNNTVLLKLTLFSIPIDEEGIKALADALIINSKLQQLFLRGTKIGDQGVKLLASGLEQNTALQYLSLQNNDINQQGAEYLLKALSNSAIKTLDISTNNIGYQGVETLISNTKLETLYASQNDIGDEGAEAVATALKANNDLRVLSLAFVKIGAPGAKALAEALKANPRLSYLDLNANDIGDDGVKALEDMLKENKNPRELRYTHNGIGYTIWQ